MKPILTILLLLLSCKGALTLADKGHSPGQQNEKILEVDYDHGGGEANFSLILKITRDSVLYDATTDYDGTNNRFLKIIKKQKNTLDNWEKLISAINLKDFDKIKSGPNLRRNDGSDIQLMVITSKKTHFLIVDKNNYPELKGLIDKLQLIVERFSRKARIFS